MIANIIFSCSVKTDVIFSYYYWLLMLNPDLLFYSVSFCSFSDKSMALKLNHLVFMFLFPGLFLLANATRDDKGGLFSFLIIS